MWRWVFDTCNIWWVERRVHHCKGYYRKARSPNYRAKETDKTLGDSDCCWSNSFYDLFIYNEYVADIYSTSRLKHFEDILKDNEFIQGTPGMGYHDFNKSFVYFKKLPDLVATINSLEKEVKDLKEKQ